MTIYCTNKIDLRVTMSWEMYKRTLIERARPIYYRPTTFSTCDLMAAVAFLVLGIRNRSWCVMTASSPVPVPNLKVMMSGFFFLDVIFRMEISWCRCFTLAHPALSESSRSTTRLSAVSSRWLGDEEQLIVK